VWSGEASESKPSMTCRNSIGDVKTGGAIFSRDQRGGGPEACPGGIRHVGGAKPVKANQGAAGVDGQSVAAFEAELSDNLYKLWNRMSSGSYFPPPVRRVMIPEAAGSGRLVSQRSPIA
jgi:hypothetical protein